MCNTKLKSKERLFSNSILDHRVFNKQFNLLKYPELSIHLELNGHIHLDVQLKKIDISCSQHYICSMSCKCLIHDE